MSRKSPVDRSPEEKWQIIQEGMKSGNVSETCRRHGIAANLFYRWKESAPANALLVPRFLADREKFRAFRNASQSSYGFPLQPQPTRDSLRDPNGSTVVVQSQPRLHRFGKYAVSEPPLILRQGRLDPIRT
jgi:hypothetical protein